jgi:hypothetical protein
MSICLIVGFLVIAELPVHKLNHVSQIQAFVRPDPANTGSAIGDSIGLNVECWD